MTPFNVQDGDETKYDEGDPRNWRNHCDGETVPLTALLSEWKDNYYRLEWMGPAQTDGWGDVQFADPGDHNYEEVEVSPALMRSTSHICGLG